MNDAHSFDEVIGRRGPTQTSRYPGKPRGLLRCVDRRVKLDSPPSSALVVHRSCDDFASTIARNILKCERHGTGLAPARTGAGFLGPSGLRAECAFRNDWNTSHQVKPRFVLDRKRRKVPRMKRLERISMPQRALEAIVSDSIRVASIVACASGRAPLAPASPWLFLFSDPRSRVGSDSSVRRWTCRSASFNPTRKTGLRIYCFLKGMDSGSGD